MVTQELKFAKSSLRSKAATICPCCGFRFEGSLLNGCQACGAQPVGEALPKPEIELPYYGRSLLLAVIGTLMVVVFLTQTIIALVQKAPVSLGFWSFIAAGETAAWRLKWVAIPITLIVLWAGRKIYSSMLTAPGKFCGLGYARTGLWASATVPVLIALLIGVTVPERLRQRQRGIEAGFHAQGYAIDRALLEYRLQFGTLPTDLKDLTRLPDTDGSIAAALASVDITGYKVTADVAALPTKKPQQLRGAVIMNASINNATDDSPQEGLSFTNYELPMAGEDKIMGTEDDFLVRDGVITKGLPVVRRSSSSARP
jgi:hypothetical protein